MQELIVLVLFVLALIYVGRMLYKSVKTEDGCSSGCGCDSPVHHLKKSQANKN